MQEMKYDMLGAATVLGVNKHIKSKTSIVSMIGCVENVISGNATKPGDVIRSYSGDTVEVLNTDAEGRLVLADLISLAHRTYRPKYIITVATLTGAVEYAVGNRRAGFMTNSNKLRRAIFKASEKSNEKVWELPIRS